MKRLDIIWTTLLVAIVFFMLSPYTKDIYQNSVSTHPYIVGFVKFFVLATMGELLAVRIASKNWAKTKGILYKASLWGIYGMLITLIFVIFSGGTEIAMYKGLLPFEGSNIAFAFLASVLMNLFFAPVMMSMHKITDTIVDMSIDNEHIISPVKAIHAIDWLGFIDFVILKTIPLFWIPAHTISFILQPESRVAMAAMLSIAFGVITTIAKMKAVKNKLA